MLIVEDDDVLRNTLLEVFSKKGMKVFAAATGKEAIKIVLAHKIDIALLDIRLPDSNGLSIIKEIHELDDGIIVIMLTAYPDLKTAITAIKSGAYDYINKPFDLDELKIVISKALETKRLRREVELLRYQVAGERRGGEMIGSSAWVEDTRKIITTISKTDKTTILIQGETGTGKDVVANMIHKASIRKDGPFIKLNCSAIPENLIESEMFGHAKGAFTDAKENKKGLFELANGGTLFLDEIGEMDLRLQPKILQVLESGKFRKVGGELDIHADVRVISATNRDLQKMVNENRFRADLFYRLKVMVINVIPLRERKTDIILLAEHFVSLNCKSMGIATKKLSPASKSLLMNYSWPGNIRELKNVLERAVILTHGGELEPENFPHELMSAGLPVPQPPEKNQPEITSSLDEVEKSHILRVINHTKGNKSMASKILGISRQHLRKKLNRYAAGDGGDE
jgi:DNA-binding NtrC family response regulator